MPQRETEGGEEKTFFFFWQLGCSLEKEKDIW